VDCNLSFEHHIREKVSKANQIMGIIIRIMDAKKEEGVSPWRMSRSGKPSWFQIYKILIALRDFLTN